ncbi:MAG TPA: hypothetical protein VIL88_17860 [Devosia sp.]|jgi:hypothetical protein|uniref:hypothetical protein n=1 Tax=Devosia sp. TaxID=1871048 RepID=UPI002F957182
MARPDIHDSPAAIAERARQAAAERARRYRAAKREEGKPDAKSVDAALSEAVSFLSSVAVPDNLTLSIAEVHRTAVIILVRDGARRSYARQAVSARMKPRTMHDDTTTLPSRRLTPTTRIIEPPVGSTWKDTEIGFVRSLLARWRAVVKPIR